jgi:ATP-dependent DNA ligase
MAKDRFARLNVPLETEPMEAKLVAELPGGEGWQYEPKWDGFRCLAYRDGAEIALMSKSGKPLDRYFPELVALLMECAEQRFVVDGEIVLPIGGVLSFDALQMRLHPAASRVARLSRETPAELVLFDCLQVGAKMLLDRPLGERRAALEAFAADTPAAVMLSPAATDLALAQRWLEGTGGALDGVMAKRVDEPYRPGARAMFKHKVERTADCVVGGYRLDKAGTGVASLLLGLYDEAGLLHHVGFSSAFSAEQRPELLALLQPLKGPSAFTGSAPGGVSRWSKDGKASEWVPLRAE